MLKVTNLSLQIGGNQILEDVSLTVNAGEIVGLIGPNGAGKTSFINVVSGQLTPSAGTVFWNDVELDRLDTVGRVRSGMGRTFQTSSLFDELSVRDNIRLALWRGVYGTTKQFALIGHIPNGEAELMRISKLVGCDTKLDTLCGSLSHGDRRKLEIALLLGIDARLLLLDEPTAGINQSEVEPIAALLRELRAAKHAVLLVEHRMEFILGLADRLVVLAGGRIIATGDVETIMSSDFVRDAYLGSDVFS